MSTTPSRRRLENTAWIRRFCFLVCVLAAPLFAGGCMGRAISEGVGLALGPKGVAVPITPISHAKRDHALARYTMFETEVFANHFGGHLPRGITTHVRPALERALAERHIRSRRGGQTLLIRGQILHYETAALVDNALGPLEEVIARVYFVDKDTGHILGVYNCVGRTTQTVNLGVDKKVEGLAEAIANVIARHYPRP
ncbi:MAG: hypothetical protein FWE88_07545 [Phycisphaerae bacterium]|nr:hypothetical protein [Phycisphaerae bacterium]